VLCLVIQCSLATLSEHDHCALMCTGLGGFVACNALSQRNEDPIKASRPWDMVCLHLSLNLSLHFLQTVVPPITHALYF
jgi:hypothetical protein